MMKETGVPLLLILSTSLLPDLVGLLYVQVVLFSFGLSLSLPLSRALALSFPFDTRMVDGNGEVIRVD